jgi:hypothetical protein
VKYQHGGNRRVAQNARANGARLRYGVTLSSAHRVAAAGDERRGKARQPRWLIISAWRAEEEEAARKGMRGRKRKSFSQACRVACWRYLFT